MKDTCSVETILPEQADLYRRSNCKTIIPQLKFCRIVKILAHNNATMTLLRNVFEEQFMLSLKALKISPLRGRDADNEDILDFGAREE